MRSPIRVSLAAIGVTPWIPLDYLAYFFNVGLYGSVSEDANAITYSIEATPDNPNYIKGNNVVSLTRSTTTATVTMANPHGLVTGDSAVIYNSGDPNLDGSQIITVTGLTTFTYTVANTGATVGTAYTQAVLCRVFALAAGLTSQTGRANGVITEPCMAVRLHVTALTGGTAFLEVIQGLARG
jgi:hypothetical protein